MALEGKEKKSRPKITADYRTTKDALYNMQVYARKINQCSFIIFSAAVLIIFLNERGASTFASPA